MAVTPTPVKKSTKDKKKGGGKTKKLAKPASCWPADRRKGKGAGTRAVANASNDVSKKSPDKDPDNKELPAPVDAADPPPWDENDTSTNTRVAEVDAKPGSEPVVPRTFQADIQGVGIGKKAGRLNLKIARSALDFATADRIFTDTEVVLTIVCDPNAALDADGQDTLVDTRTVDLQLAVQCNSFKVDHNYWAAFLSFPVSEVADWNELARAAYSSARITCHEVSEQTTNAPKTDSDSLTVSLQRRATFIGTELDEGNAYDRVPGIP